MISEMNQYGYLKIQGLENVVNQPECCGIDFYGTELLEGDEIVIDQENFQEQILKGNLKRYLEERVFFTFHNINEMGVVLDESRLTVFAEKVLEKVLHEEYGFEFTTA
ncbi:MAG: hypothetical protein K0Q87_100 [Neobacillus sp.]|nr:hypothetical protein [Neobacillus sp.]